MPPQTYWCIAVILHCRVEIWKPKKEKKRQNLLILSLSVPHTRVELVIYCVRGSCPGPLDECGSFWTISLSKSGAKVQLFFELANFCIKKNITIHHNTFATRRLQSKIFIPTHHDNGAKQVKQTPLETKINLLLM